MQKRCLVISSLLLISILFIAGCQYSAVGGGSGISRSEGFAGFGTASGLCMLSTSMGTFAANKDTPVIIGDTCYTISVCGSSSDNQALISSSYKTATQNYYDNVHITSDNGGSKSQVYGQTPTPRDQTVILRKESSLIRCTQVSNNNAAIKIPVGTALYNVFLGK